MSKRAVFEEVADRAAPATRVAERAPWRRGIAAWLWTLAALVAAMILIGGLTRLTDSGLSITVWDPVMGAIPPLSDADWEAAFAAYKTTTEFQVQNHWMTLEDFKPIFWWEWGHRLFGRLIGAVWALGFVTFLIARRIPQGWTGALLGLGLLGGLQGAIGWWMVVSGLDKLDVASYRLATHLGLAFLILMALVWSAMTVRLDGVQRLQARRRRLGTPMGWAGALLALVFVQIVSGALVAGIDAGRGYVDWPLMQGRFVPEGLMALEPAWRNAFENAAFVQFSHRMLAYGIGLIGLLALWSLLQSHNRGVRRWGSLSIAALWAQGAIGVVTVVNAAPLEIAIFHQAGAILLIAALVRLRYAAAYPPAVALRG